MKRFSAVFGLLSAEAASIVALVLVGRFMRFDIRNADPIDNLMAIVRVVTLVAVLWLTVTTLTYLVAGVRRVRIPRWFTIPMVRRVVDGALAMVITTGGIAPPALAAPPPVIVTVDPSGMVMPPGVAVGHQRTSTSNPIAAVPQQRSFRSADSVTVHVGDNLWKIASRHLETLGMGADRLPSYWVAVVEVNRNLLRSGNPDLIYPGETVLLPPV